MRSYERYLWGPKITVEDVTPLIALNHFHLFHLISNKGNQAQVEWQSRHFAEHVLFLIPGKIFVPPTLTPKLAKSTTAFCISNYGVDYVGDLDVTVGGHACLQWSSKEAKALSKNKNFSPEVSLPGNKCRNPDKDPEGPWCYVMVSGNVTVDYCDLPLCGNNDKNTQ